MKTVITALSGVLVVQLLLAAALNINRDEYGVFEPDEALLAFENATVDGIRITDGEDGVELRKNEQGWMLPASGGFPASRPAVESLLDTLAGLKRGWPVATTGRAAERFKVDKERFERKLTLLSGGEKLAVLYVGSSPGFRKVHVRSGGEDDVYSVEFNVWEAGVGPDEWIDKEILALDESTLARIELPGITLERDGDTLRLAGLTEDEQMDTDGLDHLVRRITRLRIDGLFDKGPEPEHHQDEPALEFTAERGDGSKLIYRFSKPEEESFYILKRSDRDHFFKVAESAVSPLLEARRGDFVTKEQQTTEQERPPGADKTAGSGSGETAPKDS